MTQEKPRMAAWLTTLLGALWLAFFPLWQDGSYTRITRAKWLGMLWLSGMTAAVVLLLLIVYLIRKRPPKPLMHPIQALALLYLLWLALSALFGSMADSVNVNGQMTVWMGAIRYEGLATQGCYILLFLLMSLFPGRPRVVINAAAIGLLGYAAIVALQYAGFNPFWLFPEGMSVVTVPEFQGPIGNIDLVSGYLCLMMPVLLFSFTLRGTGALALLSGSVGALLLLLMEVQSGLIALAATLAALFLLMLLRPETRCRGCLALACVLAMVSLRLLLGLPWFDDTEQLLFPHAFRLWKLAPLVLADVFLLLSAVTRWHPGPAVRLRWVLLLTALGMAAVLLAVALLPLPEGNGLWELQEVLHGRPQDGFGSERLGVWRLTLQMSRDNLLFGTGPDTFWFALQRFMYETDQSLVQSFDNPHNMLLSILSGSGLPALLLYVALMACAAVLCLRAFRSGENPWPLALLAGLVAYLLQGMFTFSLCLISPMFWVMLGMAISLTRRQEVTL